MDASKKVSSVSFKSEALDHIGTSAWHNFVAAAKVLADVESEIDKPYPQADSHCLLCQQPLSADAHSLIQRLWGYLESEARDLVNLSIGEMNEKKELLKKLALFDLSVDFSTPYKYIKEQNSELETKIILAVQVLRERRDGIVLALESKSLPVVEFLPTFDILELEEKIKIVEAELNRLRSVNLAEEIERLNLEKLELEHRETLGQILPEVLEYIKRLGWAESARKTGGSTARITKFHNQLFSSLVTDRYIELFEENLKSLGRPLKVKVQTKGKKGDTLKQIVLVADETAKNIAKPEKVLSEGEKRAVALADFLTEVVLDTSSSGIILDDPVTSLDLDWREAIAKVLVEQASHHQVIVFTHDLPFLYHLTEFAEESSIGHTNSLVKRGDVDDLPGYTFVNNSPALEKNYKKAKIAKEWYEKSKTVSASEQEKCLKEGFGALRTSYEAFIIFEMFNEVVMRFSERISFGRLDGIVWDEEIAKAVIKKCETLSRFIEGHLHSDLFVATKPTPDTLLQEINDFNKLLDSLKALKKEKINF
ncbi:AAA family ATPase [Candidatus Villigracilis affinis]|uniref:AAA family ATPase n=1 Tax=Candidatus Villigracilis affinis TaxID=3140682 RepID=UPI001D87DE60|nr:AAA family ATPase [Anaerolineales bacterium]